MNIEATTRLLLDQMDTTGSITSPSTENTNAFNGIFGDAMNQLTTSQVEADQAMQALVMGEDVQMHDVMIQTTEAQLSLELAVQVRNKCIEAFNDIKNMQF